MCLSCVKLTDGIALGSIWPFFYVIITEIFLRLFFNEIGSVSQVQIFFHFIYVKVIHVLPSILAHTKKD